MDHSDWRGSGFSLFPMPPTPPANKSRARVPSNGQHNQQNVPPRHRRSELLQLLPAPLKVRKKNHAADNHISAPEAAWINGFDRVHTPTLDQRRPFSDPLEAQGMTLASATAPVNDRRAFRASKATSLSSRDQQASPRTSIVHSSSSIKPPSSRSSLWWDPNGQVDRKKLSVYLSQVLDSSFDPVEDPNDQTLMSPSFANQVFDRREGAYGSAGYRYSYFSDDMHYCLSPESEHGGEYPTITTVSCSCPPGTVICQCHSSPEFERFRKSKAEHKPQPSISSTTCYLSVPRARFHSTLGDVHEVDTPASPPELMYDSEDSEGSDWSLPNSPTVGKTERDLHLQTPTPAPRARVPNTYRPAVPSFSLPFSHGRQIRPRLQHDRRHTGMPWEQQDASPTSTIPTLASISTISTFTFDFGDNDNATEYDPFEEGSVMTEIRTWEPIHKAKPVLVHLPGPSPQSSKYVRVHRYKKSHVGAAPSEQSEDSSVFT